MANEHNSGKVVLPPIDPASKGGSRPLSPDARRPVSAASSPSPVVAEMSTPVGGSPRAAKASGSAAKEAESRDITTRLQNDIEYFLNDTFAKIISTKHAPGASRDRRSAVTFLNVVGKVLAAIPGIGAPTSTIVSGASEVVNEGYNRAYEKMAARFDKVVGNSSLAGAGDFANNVSKPLASELAEKFAPELQDLLGKKRGAWDKIRSFAFKKSDDELREDKISAFASNLTSSAVGAIVDEKMHAYLMDPEIRAGGGVRDPEVARNIREGICGRIEAERGKMSVMQKITAITGSMIFEVKPEEVSPRTSGSLDSEAREAGYFTVEELEEQAKLEEQRKAKDGEEEAKTRGEREEEDEKAGGLDLEDDLDSVIESLEGHVVDELSDETRQQLAKTQELLEQEGKSGGRY